jgi:GDPmannose 4,6-dehydratase
MSSVLITGVDGQLGTYLSKIYLSNGDKVFGISRKTGLNKDINYLNCNINNKDNVDNIIASNKFNYIYNLAADSSVSLSWKKPQETLNNNILPVLNILEAIKNHSPNSKFFQASSSEIFGNNFDKTMVNENSALSPNSPYGISKASSHMLVKLYRDSFDIYACCGILYASESPLRDKKFVTKKIISKLVEIKNDNNGTLSLGNILLPRDWSFAGDSAQIMSMILKNKTPDDFIIASGNQYSIKDFINEACNILDMPIYWMGNGINLKALCSKTERVIVSISPEFFRPNEKAPSIPDISKLDGYFNERSKTSFKEIVDILINNEMALNK